MLDPFLFPVTHLEFPMSKPSPHPLIGAQEVLPAFFTSGGASHYTYDPLPPNTTVALIGIRIGYPTIEPCLLGIFDDPEAALAALMGITVQKNRPLQSLSFAVAQSLTHGLLATSTTTLKWLKHGEGHTWELLDGCPPELTAEHRKRKGRWIPFFRP